MVRNRKWIAIFLTPATALFLFVYAVSIVILFGTSFADWTIGSEIQLQGIGNFVSLLKDGDFLQSVVNTLIWIVLQSTVHVAIGVVFALILARRRWYFKFARASFMLPNIISSAALGMLFLSILNPQFGLVNTLIRALGGGEFSHNWFMDRGTAFWAVTMTWLPYAAVVCILVLSEISSIPEAVYEAARVDGASEFQASIYITLPMMRNIIGTATILAATSMLQKLDIIMMTTSGGPGNRTLNMPMFIYQTAFRENNFGRANAAGVYLIVLGLICVGLITKIYRVGEPN